MFPFDFWEDVELATTVTRYHIIFSNLHNLLYNHFIIVLGNPMQFCDLMFSNLHILLSPAGRAGDYKTHSVRVCMRACVCLCVIECVSHFYKGLYITLVVSPWPFQCFL